MAETVKKSVVKKRNQSMLSSSAIRLSFYNEKEDATREIDNYHLEYRTYLLRKIQNRVLARTKQLKENGIKRYFVFQKRRYEELLDVNLNLNKEVNYFKTYYELLCEISKKIMEGEEVLKVLKETEFDSLLNTLSDALSYSLNQLQLVDIDKNSIEDAFREKIWGPGSEIEMCLKKIQPFLSDYEVELSKIASEVSEIKKLSLANTRMRARFNSLYSTFSEEIVETNYKFFKGTMKNSFEEREKEKSQNSASILKLNHNFECFCPDIKPAASQQLGLSFTNFEGSYAIMPNSSSTPQQNNKALN